MKTLNWDARYTTFDNGYKQLVHAATGSICCWCMKVPSTCVHHAEYGKGDLPGIHCFGLCDDCHSDRPGYVHHPDNWQKSKTDPVFGNRNTELALMRLKFGYSLRQT